MSNCSINIVTLSGDNTRIFEVLNAIKCDDQPIGSVDFNKITPAPAGSDYKWRCENWGTLGNAIYDDEWEFTELVEISETSVRIEFVTDGNGACPVIAKLAKMNADLEIEHMWSEDSLVYEGSGKDVYVNGECIDHYFPRGEESVIFACKVWDVEESIEDYLECYREENE